VASLEDFLRYGSTTQVNATRPQPQKPAVIRQKQVLDELYEKSLATGTVAKPQAGGIKGLFADILESPVGKAVMGAANVIDIPRRAIISTGKELIDAFDGNPETAFSFNELTEQIKDPSFGFGDVTGNLFGESGIGMFFNRVVGFAGDVLLDPTTYITMGANKAISYGDDLAKAVVKESGERVFQQSAKTVAKAKAGRRGLSVAGQEGRLALGRRLATLGADDATVASAVRYGRAGVKDAELLAKAGVDRAGLYWFGKRIAGTTRVGEALESGLSKSRVWFGDHLFSKPSKVFTPGDAVDARRALARGQVAPGAAKEFMLFVVSRNEERAMEAAARREGQIVRNEILGAVAKEDIDAARGSAYKLMDYSDRASTAAGVTADERVASAARQFFDRLIGNVKQKMLAIDPEAPIGEVDFYFPHFQTENAQRWASNSANPQAVKMREFMYNPFENTGAYKTRMQEGDEFFGTILTKEDIAGGVDRLNEIAIKSGEIDFNFFETDLPTVLDRYIDSYAKQQGRIARKKFLIDEDVYKTLEKRMGPDDDLIAKSSRVVNRRVKARDKALSDANDIAGKMLDEVERVAGDIAWANRSNIEAGQDAVRSTLRGRLQMKNTIRKTLSQLDELSGKLLAHQSAYNDLFNVVPWSVAMLQREYDRVLDRINAMREAYGIMEIPVDQLRKEIGELEIMISDLRRTEASLRENAMTIQYHLDDIVEGKTVEGLTKQAQESIRKAIYGDIRVKGGKEVRVSGEQAQPLNANLWNSIKDEVVASGKGGPKGKMTDAKEQIIMQRYQQAGGQWGNARAGARGTKWWMRANRRAEISADKVEKMATGQNISDVVTRSLGGDASLTELRTAALALLSISDHIPEKLSEDLKRILEVADEADDFFNRLAKGERDKSGRIVLEQTLDNWVKVQTQVVDSIRGYFQANRILNAGLGIENLDPNDVFPNDLLRRIVAEDNSPLSRLFEPFIGDDITNIEELAGMATRFDVDELDFIEGGFKVHTPGNSRELVSNYMRPGNEPDGRMHELTVGEFVDILSKYVNEIENTVHEASAIGRRVGQPDTVASVQIRMKDILSQTNLDGRRVIDMDNLDEVEDFISTFVTGKARKTTTQEVASLTDRLSKVPAIQAIKTLPDRFPIFRIQNFEGKQYPAMMELRTLPGTSDNWFAFMSWDTGIKEVLDDGTIRDIPGGQVYASIAEDLEIVKAHFEERLKKASRNRDSLRMQGSQNFDLENQYTDELRQALRQVDEAITATRAVQVPARTKGGSARVLTGAEPLARQASIADEIDKLRAQIAENYSNISVSDANYNWTRQASDDEVRAARRDVAAGRGGRKGVETAKRTKAGELARKSVESVQEELADTLRTAWFFSEVETRFQRAADALFKVGLAPDKDLYRRILNIVARDKGELLARERMLYSRSHATLKTLLDDIGSPNAWVGREKELYDTIIRAINPKGMDGAPAEWAHILSRVSGRADASRLRTKILHYGDNSGVALKRRKLRSQLNSKNLTAEERLAIKAEYDALPDAATMNAEKKRFLNEELRPWYKANWDGTKENPSWGEIAAAVSSLHKIKSGGGRLAEDASARELRSWVKDAVDKLESGARNSIGKTGWLYDAADPYFVAKNFEEAMIGGQDLPYMYASSLMRLADQYEAAAQNFLVRQTAAADASAKLAEALPAERAALDKQRALAAQPGDKAPTLKSVTADEAERKALEAARKVQRQLVELKNTDEWLAAVERNSLNELIKLFAVYGIAAQTDFTTRVPAWQRARELYKGKNEIYVRVASGDAEKYELVTNASNIVEGGVYYTKPQGADVIGDQYQRIADSPSKVLRWSDADGGEFRLTPEELDSLFMDPKEFASMRASKRAQYDNMIRSMDRDIIKLESNIKEMEYNIRTYMYGGDPKLVAEMRDELRRSEANLEVLRESRASMNFTSFDREMVIRNSALEKMSGLLQMIKSGQYSMDEIQYGLKRMAIDYTSPVNVLSDVNVSKRVKYLDDAWVGSSEQKLFDKVRQLEFSEQAALFNAAMADTNKVLSTVGKLREAASKAWQNTPEDGAPYGRGGFSIAKYNDAIRAGKSKEEAVEAGRVVRNISDGVVYDGDKAIKSGRNVQEARAIVSGIDANVRKELREITRTTRGQYDAEARFDELISNGVDPVAAARKINDEIRSLLPSDEALFRSASFEKNMASIEVARNKIGFFTQTMDSSKQWFWSPEGFGQELQALQIQVGNIAQELGDARIAHEIWVGEEAARMLGNDAVVAKATSLVANIDSMSRAQIEEALREITLAASRGGSKSSFDYRALYRRMVKNGSTPKEAAMQVERQLSTVRPNVVTDGRIPGYGGIMQLESTLLDTAKLLKQSDTQVEDARIWYKWTKPMLERRVKKAEAILNGVARREYDASLRAGGLSATEDSRAELMDWVDRMITTIEDMNGEVDLLTALRADYLNAQSTLVNQDKLANLALRQLADLKSLKWGAQVADQMEEGLVNLAKAGLPSYYASERIAEMSINMQRMRQPEFVRGLNRFIGRYTGYFKAGAVGTPGFVVRNTISNTFSLVSAGADPSNMTRGLSLFAQWKKAAGEGRELDWLNGLSDLDREIVSTAVKAMDASGYGRAEEALAGWAPKRKWLTDNAYYRRIRKWNETSEQSARFILAYDSAAKGASFDEATAIVKRYFFDYVDVSNADIAIRSVVPFWFWMSRNLPLQIVNQWTHPRAYQIYNSVKRNFGAEEDGEQIVPSWLVERGAIGMGGRYFLAPDFPMSRINQQVAELGDPKRLLNYVNPGLRVPFEVMFSSRRLYNDVPFNTDSQSPVGGPLSPAVQALAELLGQGKTNAYSGERGVSDKMNYAVMSLFPQLGQLERAIPATDLYKDRQLNSLRSLLGIPIVNVTDDMIQSELRRRRYEN
jgi:hypothetical protein